MAYHKQYASFIDSRTVQCICSTSSDKILVITTHYVWMCKITKVMNLLSFHFKHDKMTLVEYINYNILKNDEVYINYIYFSF